MNRILVAFLLVTVASVALAQQQVGRVKVIHAFPTGTATVDITISQNGFVAKTLTSVPYKAASDWFYLPYGDYTVDISTAAPSSTFLLSVGIEVASYSTVVFADDDGGIAVSAFNDNINTIAAGKAHVSIAHRAVGVAEVDVGAGASTTNLANNLAYGAQTGPVEVDAGPVSAGVRPAGNTGEALLTFNATLEARKHYLVVAVGDASGTPALELIAFELADYSTNSRLAFVHGVPANLPVNIVANGALVLFRNINYQNITDYKNIPVGTHTITVENDGDAAITIVAFFNGFTEATLYATVGTSAPSGILLIDDNQAPASGNARVRVLHGAGAAPSVDVLSGTTPVISNITYGFASAYLPLPAATYQLSVNAAGTQTSVFTISLPIAAGPVITVLAAGTPGTTGVGAFTLIVVTDAIYGANGNLRAVHAVAGAPNVNIKANGNQVFSNVPFQAVSPYQSVAPGLYQVSVTAASDDGELFRSPIRVDAAGYFTAVAGGVGSDLALFQLRDDNTRPAASTTHLRVVHASAGSPEVNIEVDGSVAGSLIYTEALGYVPLPSRSYVVRVASTMGNNQVFNSSLTLEADTVISVFAVGIVGDNTNPFTVVPAIDFDFRTPADGPSGSAPGAGTAPTATPTRTPTRTSSAAIVTSSVALMALAALV
eukprot:TRINITY_DN3921_c0_g1_i1.p1 TRINITY_DN3921_c0_g1~~TRINITY_DN3921_c0_g1_i1.p1  ORF type:complete len:659 (-),score=156.68 TRINITY_DN3921_c0_g1_i1:46-2022(-)